LRYALLLGLLLAGCAVTEEARLLDREAKASLQAYARGADVAVEGLADAFLAQALDALLLQVRLALRDEAVDVEVPVLDVDGVPMIDERGFAVTERKRYVPAEIADEAAALQRSKTDDVRRTVKAFLDRWNENKRNLHDALRLREVLRTYLLERAVVEPEDVDSFAETLARELERRGY
jgi:hypothetical protein